MADAGSLILPVAALLVAGVLAGFAGGLFGIGGGFVVVPALIFILPLLGGNPDTFTHVAIGTSLATIIFTSFRSVQAHARRGAVDFALLKSWAPWVILGTAGGALVADIVSGPALAVIFGVGVGLMALHFLLPVFDGKQVSDTLPVGPWRAGIAGSLGLLSALLGIGGGTIATVVMTLCGTAIHRAIGTASGMGMIIAVPGMIGFVLIGWGEPGLPWGSLGYVNLPSALAIVATSVLSAPLGVAAAHWLSPSLLRSIFGIYLVFVGVMMIINGLA